MAPFHSTTNRDRTMQRAFQAAGLLFAFLALATSVQAKPPASFADWLRRSDATYAPTPNRIASLCLELYGDDDAKVGPCLVTHLLLEIRQARTAWEHAMTEMATGQLPACRLALHNYVRTARLLYDATRTFLRAHRDARLTAIGAGLRRQPYAHLRAIAGEAERRAIRSCGQASHPSSQPGDPT